MNMKKIFITLAAATFLAIGWFGMNFVTQNQNQKNTPENITQDGIEAVTTKLEADAFQKELQDSPESVDTYEGEKVTVTGEIAMIQSNSAEQVETKSESLGYNSQPEFLLFFQDQMSNYTIVCDLQLDDNSIENQQRYRNKVIPTGSNVTVKGEIDTSESPNYVYIRGCTRVTN